jgi:hypothetical protein
MIAQPQVSDAKQVGKGAALHGTKLGYAANACKFRDGRSSVFSPRTLLFDRSFPVCGASFVPLNVVDAKKACGTIQPFWWGFRDHFPANGNPVIKKGFRMTVPENGEKKRCHVYTYKCLPSLTLFGSPRSFCGLFVRPFRGKARTGQPV